VIGLGRSSDLRKSPVKSNHYFICAMQYFVLRRTNIPAMQFIGMVRAFVLRSATGPMEIE
jgi:hypothetical protein